MAIIHILYVILTSFKQWIFKPLSDYYVIYFHHITEVCKNS